VDDEKKEPEGAVIRIVFWIDLCGVQKDDIPKTTSVMGMDALPAEFKKLDEARKTSSEKLPAIFESNGFQVHTFSISESH
jgi:hypothetical protein